MRVQAPFISIFTTVTMSLYKYNNRRDSLFHWPKVQVTPQSLRGVSIYRDDVGVSPPAHAECRFTYGIPHDEGIGTCRTMGRPIVIPAEVGIQRNLPLTSYFISLNSLAFLSWQSGFEIHTAPSSDISRTPPRFFHYRTQPCRNSRYRSGISGTCSCHGPVH